MYFKYKYIALIRPLRAISFRGARSSRAIHSLTGHGGRSWSAVAALAVHAVPGPRCPRFPDHSFIHSQGTAGVPWPRSRCPFRSARGAQGHGARAAGCHGRGTTGDPAPHRGHGEWMFNPTISSSTLLSWPIDFSLSGSLIGFITMMDSTVSQSEVRHLHVMNIY